MKSNGCKRILDGTRTKTERIPLGLNNNYINAGRIDCFTSTRDVGAH